MCKGGIRTGTRRCVWPQYTNRPCSHNCQGAKFWEGGGDVLVPTMPGCVCREVRIWVPSQLQVNEINEKISLENGCEICRSTLYGVLDILYEI